MRDHRTNLSKKPFLTSSGVDGILRAAGASLEQIPGFGNLLIWCCNLHQNVMSIEYASRSKLVGRCYPLSAPLKQVLLEAQKLSSVELSEIVGTSELAYDLLTQGLDIELKTGNAGFARGFHVLGDLYLVIWLISSVVPGSIRPNNKRFEALVDRMELYIRSSSLDRVSSATSTLANSARTALSSREFATTLVQTIEGFTSEIAVSAFLTSQSGELFGLSQAAGRGESHIAGSIPPIAIRGATTVTYDVLSMNDRSSPPCVAIPVMDKNDQALCVVICEPMVGSESSHRVSVYELGLVQTIVEALWPHFELFASRETQRFYASRMTHELKHLLHIMLISGNYMSREFEQKGINPAEFFRYDYLADLVSSANMMNRALAAQIPMQQNLRNIRREPLIIAREVIAPVLRDLRLALNNRSFDSSDIVVTDGLRRLPKITADVQLFQTALFELLLNAVKFALDDPKCFRIVIDGSIVNPQYTEVIIQDFGIGIEESAGERIFDEGFRAPLSFRHNVTGSGMGLALVSSIIRTLGGSIRLTSMHNPTEFRILMPSMEASD